MGRFSNCPVVTLTARSNARGQNEDRELPNPLFFTSFLSSLSLFSLNITPLLFLLILFLPLSLSFSPWAAGIWRQPP